jgi:subtilisin family serine protease
LFISSTARVALFLLVLLALAGPTVAAQPAGRPMNLYLRRATFDPLRVTPRVASGQPTLDTSRLLIVQFEHVPDAGSRAALLAAGLRPLNYIPTNALLVRVLSDGTPALAAVPGVRWSGPFQPAFKLPEALDAGLGGLAAADLELWLLAAPDADVDALVRDISGRGGVLRARIDSLNGPILRVRLPGAALRDIVARDDVLWAERYVVPQARNDRSQDIVGVTAARERASWLTGGGQIVAVTDTGLDRQNNLSADFAGRVVAAFTPYQMGAGVAGCYSTSATQTWSDQNGHGTHVSGTLLGSGALAGGQYAGFAPGAQIVVQSVSSGGNYFDCFPDDMSFLSKAYERGARIQNASWGSPASGEYGEFEMAIDDYLWRHKEHLFVVAAGNEGVDLAPRDGVIDTFSISSPASAKNLLSVGATENDRPPTGSTCLAFGAGVPQQNQCWKLANSNIWGAPHNNDFVSDDVDGMAAFSSRGPAQDGRIKPEIVAPGTNVISAASHSPSATYPFGKLDANYAYDSGTSMSTPMVSGMAALVRQWLAQARGMPAPSAALVKALLLNGAIEIGPGQYGTGTTREIPAGWPNSVAGWGRAWLPGSVGLGNGPAIWLADKRDGLGATGARAVFFLRADAGTPLRITLVWTDFPGAAFASGRALVNDLDLEVRGPDGKLLRGNARAASTVACRDDAGADRCNNVESVSIATPTAGYYTVVVRGAAIVAGPQPYALAASAADIAEGAPQRVIVPYVRR